MKQLIFLILFLTGFSAFAFDSEEQELTINTLLNQGIKLVAVDDFSDKQSGAFLTLQLMVNTAPNATQTSVYKNLLDKNVKFRVLTLEQQQQNQQAENIKQNYLQLHYQLGLTPNAWLGGTTVQQQTNVQQQTVVQQPTVQPVKQPNSATLDLSEKQQRNLYKKAKQQMKKQRYVHPIADNAMINILRLMPYPKYNKLVTNMYADLVEKVTKQHGRYIGQGKLVESLDFVKQGLELKSDQPWLRELEYQSILAQQFKQQLHFAQTGEYSSSKRRDFVKLAIRAKNDDRYFPDHQYSAYGYLKTVLQADDKDEKARDLLVDVFEDAAEHALDLLKDAQLADALAVVEAGLAVSPSAPMLIDAQEQITEIQQLNNYALNNQVREVTSNKLAKQLNKNTKVYLKQGQLFDDHEKNVIDNVSRVLQADVSDSYKRAAQKILSSVLTKAFSKAQRLLDNSDYQGANKLIDKVLQISPDFKRFNQLRDRVMLMQSFTLPVQ